MAEDNSKKRRTDSEPFRWGTMFSKLGESMNPMMLIYIIGDIIQDVAELFENLVGLFKSTWIDEAAGIVVLAIMAATGVGLFLGAHWLWVQISTSVLGLILAILLAGAINGRRQTGRGGGLLWLLLGICTLATLSWLGISFGEIGSFLTRLHHATSWPVLLGWLGNWWPVFLPLAVVAGFIYINEKRRRK